LPRRLTLRRKGRFPQPRPVGWNGPIAPRSTPSLETRPKRCLQKTVRPPSVVRSGSPRSARIRNGQGVMRCDAARTSLLCTPSSRGSRQRNRSITSRLIPTSYAVPSVPQKTCASRHHPHSPSRRGPAKVHRAALGERRAEDNPPRPRPGEFNSVTPGHARSKRSNAQLCTRSPLSPCAHRIRFKKGCVASQNGSIKNECGKN